MNLRTILMIAAAICPAIWLCVYIFKKDRVEKEPLSLLLQLFLMGALACFPAALIEGVLLEKIDGFFTPLGHILDGTLYLNSTSYYAHTAVTAFFGIALVEEGIKWLVLVLSTLRSRDLNSFFDGLVYAVFVSLGFAALENVYYVFENGWGNALMRAVLSVPGHMFFGVMMGYYLSRWHVLRVARKTERVWITKGILPPGKKPFCTYRSALLSLIVPVLAHGFYDFCCMADSAIFVLAFYIFVAFLYAYCFGKIRKMSKADAPSRAYVKLLLRRKYGADYIVK